MHQAYRVPAHRQVVLKLDAAKGAVTVRAGDMERELEHAEIGGDDASIILGILAITGLGVSPSEAQKVQDLNSLRSDRQGLDPLLGRVALQVQAICRTPIEREVQQAELLLAGRQAVLRLGPLATCRCGDRAGDIVQERSTC